MGRRKQDKWQFYLLVCLTVANVYVLCQVMSIVSTGKAILAALEVSQKAREL